MIKFIRHSWSDYLFLFVLLLVSMWQVATLQSTMKWDIMDITLPWNYYITECVAQGELPFWNPFMNGGFAQMGVNDTWSPITWLIGLLFGYDPAVIQYQYLGHLYLAGIGFYHLGKYFKWGRTTRLATAAAFMLSGLMIGNAQHLGWVIGISWLPWLFLNYKKWEIQPNLFSSISLATISALMFLGGYPGIFVGFGYLLLGLAIYRIIVLWRNGDFDVLKKMMTQGVLVLFVFILLCFVALVSMLRLSSLINRGESLSLESALSGSLPWEAITTFLFPFAGVSNMSVWETDWTLINCYIGIFSFLFLLTIFFEKKLLKQAGGYGLGGVFFLAVAMGNDLPLRSWLHQLVPLMDVFRFPSYFRGIGMFFLIIGSGVAMEHFFSKKISRTTIRYFVLFSLSILALSLWGKFGVSASQSSEAKVHFFEHLSKQGWIHFGLLATLILGFLFLKKNKKRKVLFLVLVSADLIFATQLNRTSTITHDIGTKKVNSAFHYYSPKEYPLPDLKVPFKKLHRVANWDYEHLHVNLNHFHKIPSPEGNSPIYFKRTAQAMANGIYQRTIENYPLIFAAEEMDRGGLILESTVDTFSFEKIVLEKFTPNQMKFSTNFSKPMHLVFLQNYHPDWKAFLNEKPNRIRIANQNFLSIKIPSGNQKIHFAFRPKFGKISFWISWCGWVFVSVFFITIYLRKIKKLLFFDHF